MISRLENESDEKYIARLEMQLSRVLENNTALQEACNKLQKQLIANEVVNPRNGVKYKSDASNLFQAVAVAHGLLPSMPKEAKTVLDEAMHLTGFTRVDIASGKVMDDGAYNG